MGRAREIRTYMLLLLSLYTSSHNYYYVTVLLSQGLRN